MSAAPSNTGGITVFQVIANGLDQIGASATSAADKVVAAAKVIASTGGIDLGAPGDPGGSADDRSTGRKNTGGINDAAPGSQSLTEALAKYSGGRR